MQESENKGKTRREFLKYVGSFFATGLAISTVYPILTSCEKDESLPAPPPGSDIIIDLKQHPELASVPGIKKISVQNPITLTVIVKRTSQTNFLVFSSLCPHQGVDLELPQNPDGNLKCPKHFAEFSTMDSNKGTVVANPQGVKVGNLPTYQSEYDANKNILIIKLS
jgi:Rieske Fe-S protein